MSSWVLTSARWAVRLVRGCATGAKRQTIERTWREQWLGAGAGEGEVAGVGYLAIGLGEAVGEVK